MNHISKKKLAFVLFASPQNDGNTSKLLNYFLKDLYDYEIVILDAYKKNIKPCIGCGHCRSEENCIYEDFNDIDKYLNIADLLIVATPSYNLSFPAPLKAIFDRTQIYFSKRFIKNIKSPIKKQKDAIFLLTTGSDSELSRNIMTTQLNIIFSIINAKIKNVIVLENTDKIRNGCMDVESNIKIY